MADDDRTRELDISHWLPAQRTPLDDKIINTMGYADPVAELTPAEAPAASWDDVDRTVLLPVVPADVARPISPAPADVPRPMSPVQTGDAPRHAAPADAEMAEPPAKPPVPPSIPKPVPSDRLPSDERNMLIFVTALLALGTLAIVAMASIGR